MAIITAEDVPTTETGTVDLTVITERRRAMLDKLQQCTQTVNATALTDETIWAKIWAKKKKKSGR